MMLVAKRLASIATATRRLPSNWRRFSTEVYKGLNFTTSMEDATCVEAAPLPLYRILEPDGSVSEGASTPSISEDLAVKMYNIMVRLQIMDDAFFASQRQGRISFYVTTTGEEAAVVCSAAALDSSDPIFGQYREAGALLWRGFTVNDCAHQCFGTKEDLTKGRQMPVHYGSKEYCYHAISSPLGTQIPHAVGAGYRLKLASMEKSIPLQNVPVTYFGDGAASDGTFPASLNMAAVLNAPVIFICRNNGYAISTPCTEQYGGDGIVQRGPAYGIPGIRVDGNCPLAVYDAVGKARKRALKGEPVLVELMTYRGGCHSTSDDWTKYRSTEEVEEWEKVAPLKRFYHWLCNQGWWDDKREEVLRIAERQAVIGALLNAESTPFLPVATLFDDVYHKVTPAQEEQRQSLLEHLQRMDEIQGS